MAHKRAHCGGVPPPTVGCRRQDAVAAQRVEQLDDLIRITAGEWLGQLGKGRSPRPVDVQHLSDHAQGAGFGQIFQPHTPYSRMLPPPRHHRRQGMRTVTVVVAVGAHEKQALEMLFAEHEIDETQRGAPSPLQVVEEHHQRPTP